MSWEPPGKRYLCDSSAMQHSIEHHSQGLATVSGLLVWLLLGVSLIFSACLKDVVYEQQVQLPKAAWSITDTLRFQFDISDTTVYYDINLALRIDREYPFSNLYVMSRLKGSQGQDISDLKGFELADKTGKWKGRSYSGLISFELPLMDRFVFQQSGTYTLYLIQYMRRDRLSGIHDAGIQVTKGDPLL